MEFSNHCQIGSMTREGSSSTILEGSKTPLPSPIWFGGMVTAVSSKHTLTSTNSAHHHHSETTPVLDRVPVSSQWFLDRSAPYASFSFHADNQDLFETSCLMDCLSSNASGLLGIASYPLALISTAINNPSGTSLSFSGEVSERHSVCHDVLFSTMCISDYSDRASLYPIIGHILFDTLLEESLAEQFLYMTGKDDSGPIQSEDASCDESAQISRNGGVVASATTPEKVMLFFLSNRELTL